MIIQRVLQFASLMQSHVANLSLQSAPYNLQPQPQQDNDWLKYPFNYIIVKCILYKEKHELTKIAYCSLESWNLLKAINSILF